MANRREEVGGGGHEHLNIWNINHILEIPLEAYYFASTHYMICIHNMLVNMYLRRLKLNQVSYDFQQVLAHNNGHSLVSIFAFYWQCRPDL